MDEIKHGGEIDWDRFGEECSVIAEYLDPQIGLILGLPHGRTSWMHMVGVAALLLTRTMTVEGPNENMKEWLHDQLLKLHELSHVFMEDGAAAAARAVDAMADPDPEGDETPCGNRHLH